MNQKKIMTQVKELFIYIDGAAKGNPGPAGAGIVIYEDSSTDKDPLKKISEYLGEATNNAAEYLALIFALQEAIDLQATHLFVYTDSELLARQFSGTYKVKNENLKVLYGQVRDLVDKFDRVKIEHIRREYNKPADKLATEAVKQRNKLNGNSGLHVRVLS
ncbi:MAG: ribonuclease HI family protein [Candidatus Omnitrophica bacterium]|nr:ribonuclease HI family protein [Candidatus Omnitrophota bacterium]